MSTSFSGVLQVTWVSRVICAGCSAQVVPTGHQQRKAYSKVCCNDCAINYYLYLQHATFDLKKGLSQDVRITVDKYHRTIL